MSQLEVLSDLPRVGRRRFWVGLRVVFHIFGVVLRELNAGFGEILFHDDPFCRRNIVDCIFLLHFLIVDSESKWT